ncbi:MAG: hypothetical protein DCC65_18005 [Planctomycetota bacterium]|nr:MAG: hypothetical protein DCC65_18005 [Planctomycetota bacterium]
MAVDGCGRFVVAWGQETFREFNDLDVVTLQYEADGTPLSMGPKAVGVDQQAGAQIFHERPSVAMSFDGLVRIGWLGSSKDTHYRDPTAFTTEFAFGDVPPEVGVPLDSQVPGYPPDPFGIHHEPSVGMSESGGRLAYVVTQTFSSNPNGVIWGADWLSPNLIEPCGPSCYPGRWQPCIAQRSEDGVFAIVWADAENDLSDPPTNIALYVYNAAGQLLETLEGPSNDQWVNNPDLEDPIVGGLPVRTAQLSPAVAFVGDDIVVTWAGRRLKDWTGGPTFHIFARHFKYDDGAPAGSRLRDPIPGNGEGRAGLFRVNSNVDVELFDPDNANPTVSISPAASGPQGRFIIAWNSQNNAESREEVRAQYFDGLCNPRGSEFRVNQATTPTVGPNNVRVLAESGQHTVGYGAQDQVVATWSPYVDAGGFGALKGVYVTILPPDYAQASLPACDICQTNPELCDPCRKGDVNGDCKVDGLDIQVFVDLLLDGSDSSLDIVSLCPRDTNSDGAHTLDDIPCFVATLLAGVNTCTITPSLRGQDCNSNDTADLDDIANQTSDDLNENGVPDECEDDCNENGTVDEIDVLTETSPDCNENGIPDECEPDCNTNGVPDDCDVDPTDPDEDEWVSPDCNENAYPDECDLSLAPPFGSLDCNDNQIPDECDIAECEGDPACDDCNANGVPDACDIAAEISEDANTNGIPDECEGESLMGGGGESSMMSEGGESEGGESSTGETPMPPEEEAAWEAFYQWSAAQCWGPGCETTGAEQFAAMADKLEELGLSLGQLSP